MQTDPDTEKELGEGEALVLMTQSAGWGIARALLIEDIMDLQNIHNVSDASIDNVVVDIKSRKAAVAILYAWLKKVEGRVEQHAANKASLIDKGVDDYIQREKEDGK